MGTCSVLMMSSVLIMVRSLISCTDRLLCSFSSFNSTWVQ